ncbi:MAG TPA: hypothetical protein VG142_01430 [Trebonia sp.]|nr:hypothetical protein [Trebonia sp.]
MSADLYRSAANAASFRGKLQSYLAQGKPLAITEFGSCTYRGAAVRVEAPVLARAALADLRTNLVPRAPGFVSAYWLEPSTGPACPSSSSRRGSTPSRPPPTLSRHCPASPRTLWRLPGASRGVGIRLIRDLDEALAGALAALQAGRQARVWLPVSPARVGSSTIQR